MDEVVKSMLDKAADLLKAAGAREVYVFGSAARGSMTSDSDVDLAVLGLPPEKYFQGMELVASVLGRPVDLIDLDGDSPFTRYLLQEDELQRVA